ncbi:hypothetical protein [Paenibacillus chitinolyticus]|uniref:hypothetical protein n=3 Tax=Paenibacillus chitinolyticus TaxID=79263 RepID=UPI003639BC1B
MKIRLIFFVLVVLFVAGCEKVDVPKVIASANEAFESKDYKTFNTQIELLKKGDKKEYENYLSTVKNKDLFKVEKQTDLKKVESSISDLTMITEQVPKLSDEAKSKIASLKENRKYFDEVDSIVSEINQVHLKESQSAASDSNYSVFLMKNYDVTSKVVKALKKLSDDTNKKIITLESLKAPDFLSEKHKGFIESLKVYKTKLDAKATYIDSKAAEIVFSNDPSSLSILALSTINDIHSDLERLTSEVRTAISDVKQRGDSF